MPLDGPVPKHVLNSEAEFEPRHPLDTEKIADLIERPTFCIFMAGLAATNFDEAEIASHGYPFGERRLTWSIKYLGNIYKYELIAASLSVYGDLASYSPQWALRLSGWGAEKNERLFQVILDERLLCRLTQDAKFLGDKKHNRCEGSLIDVAQALSHHLLRRERGSAYSTGHAAPPDTKKWGSEVYTVGLIGNRSDDSSVFYFDQRSDDPIKVHFTAIAFMSEMFFIVDIFGKIRDNRLLEDIFNYEDPHIASPYSKSEPSGSNDLGGDFDRSSTSTRGPGRPVRRKLVDPSQSPQAEINRPDAMFRTRLPKPLLAEIEAFVEANGLTKQDLVIHGYECIKAHGLKPR